MARALYDDPANSIAEICRTLRVSRATLYRYVKATPQAQAARAAPASQTATGERAE